MAGEGEVIEMCKNRVIVTEYLEKARSFAKVYITKCTFSIEREACTAAGSFYLNIVHI